MLIHASVAWAQGGGESEDELDRWVPSLAASIQIHGQKASGSATSSNVLGTPLTTVDALGNGCLQQTRTGPRRTGNLCDQLPGPRRAPLQIFPDSSSSDVGVAMAFGASLELMTPRLTERLFSPRLFAHADATLVLAFERNLAGNGSPGKFGPPRSFRGFDPLEIAFRGQGSRAKSEVQPFLFSAGVGPAFSARLFGRTLRIKPSFEYLWQQQKIIGIGHRLVKQEEDTTLPTEDLEDFRRIQLDDERIEDQHGVGIGLEIEMDSGRLGPFVLSPYIWGRGYRVLGDLDYALKVSNRDPDGVSAEGVPESATYTFDFEPWVWRAGLGIRFRFVP